MNDLCQNVPGALVARTLALLLTAGTSLGCGDDAAGTEPSNGPLDAGPDAPAPDADRSDANDRCPSSCDDAAAVQSNGQVAWECESEALCEAVGFEAPPGFAITTVDTVDTLASARCALDAMRDGRVGHFLVRLAIEGLEILREQAEQSG